MSADSFDNSETREKEENSVTHEAAPSVNVAVCLSTKNLMQLFMEYRGMRFLTIQSVNDRVHHLLVNASPLQKKGIKSFL